MPPVKEGGAGLAKGSALVKSAASLRKYSDPPLACLPRHTVETEGEANQRGIVYGYEVIEMSVYSAKACANLEKTACASSSLGRVRFKKYSRAKMA